MQYSRVCVAGTFDNIHAGHEAMLRKAFAVGKKVLIALTSDQFVKQHKGHGAAPYAARLVALTDWLAKQRLSDRATIVPIDDPYEPAVSMKELDALVVSEHTKSRGADLNRKRALSGLSPLVLIVVPMKNAEDGRGISSSRIRQGDIDRKGRLVLPDILRDRLTQPLGFVLTNPDMAKDSFARHKNDIIVVVGDCSAQTLLAAKMALSLLIIDNKVGRKVFHGLDGYRGSVLKKTHHVKSGPGFIAKEATDFIALWGENPHTSAVLEVEGEEDLLTLPAILAAPLESVLYYGQPPIEAWACGPVVEGLVEVVVTKEKKAEAQELLNQFTMK